MKDIGIVICNFNKKEYLYNCLQSITKATFEGYTYDIIVVDNASTDGSEEMLRDEFKEVIVIQTGANLGGAGGFARGMEYAIDKKYPYIAILDNDTIVEASVFINLIGQLNRDTSLGIAGATILQMDDPEKIQEMGAMFNWDKYELSLNYNDYAVRNSLIPDAIECDYVPACCFMTKLEVLEKVGVFDESFFIYFDDIDWSFRVKNNGYRIKAFKNAYVWHKGGAKIATSTFPQYFFYRNFIRFVLKNIEGTKVDSFVNNLSEIISKMVFFGNLKGQYGSAKSALIAIDDAYAKNFGAQWDGIFPKVHITNKFYELCASKKNILIFDQYDLETFKQIIKNIQTHTDAEITIVCEFQKKEEILNVTNRTKVFDQTEDISTYDFVIKSLYHISEYKEAKEYAYFIDAFGNYIVDEDDKVAIEDYFVFIKTYDNVIKPTIEHKLKKIYENSHN